MRSGILRFALNSSHTHTHARVAGLSEDPLFAGGVHVTRVHVTTADTEDNLIPNSAPGASHAENESTALLQHPEDAASNAGACHLEKNGYMITGIAFLRRAMFICVR